jgi:methylenetetrahydrofolate reductase (NADPH)
MTAPKISLEFFPPKTAQGAAKLRAVRAELYALKPEFCSVTYGAGGSTQEGTFTAVQEILNEGVPVASHFSCVGATKARVREQLQQLKTMGVQRLVALRGDLPSGYGSPGELQYSSDLVRFIREETGEHFHITVACYPEVHPQAKSPQDDLKAYAAKVQAGANSAITQMFFNTDAYWRFVEDAHKAGITLPVIPGIMPITNASGLLRFADGCGCEVPRWVRLRLQSFGDDAEAIKDFGLDVVAALCDKLQHQGVQNMHFYTMNQSASTQAIVQRLGWA